MSRNREAGGWEQTGQAGREHDVTCLWMETCNKSPGAIGNAGRMCIPQLERIPSAVIQEQSLVHTGGGGTALLIPLCPRSSPFPGGLSHCPRLHVKFSWERWRVFQSQLLPVILQFLAIGLSQHPWPPWLGSPGGRVKDALLCSCLGTGRRQECGKGPGAGILFWINSRLQLPFLKLPSLTDEHFKSAMCANFPLQTRSDPRREKYESPLLPVLGSSGPGKAGSLSR